MSMVFIRGAHARRGRRGDDRITNATTQTATTSSPIPLREYLRNGAFVLITGEETQARGEERKKEKKGVAILLCEFPGGE